MMKLLLLLCRICRCFCVVLESGDLQSSMQWEVIVLCLMCFLSWCSCVRFRCFGFLIIIRFELGMLILILIIVVVISRCILFCLKVCIIVCFFVGFICLWMRLILSFGSVSLSFFQVVFVVWVFSRLDFLISVQI